MKGRRSHGIADERMFNTKCLASDMLAEAISQCCHIDNTSRYLSVISINNIDFISPLPRNGHQYRNTYVDHPNKGGRAQTSPKHQAKMRSPLARLRVIFREYCIGRTIAKYLERKRKINQISKHFDGPVFLFSIARIRLHNGCRNKIKKSMTAAYSLGPFPSSLSSFNIPTDDHIRWWKYSLPLPRDRLWISNRSFYLTTLVESVIFCPQRH